MKLDLTEMYNWIDKEQRRSEITIQILFKINAVQ